MNLNFPSFSCDYLTAIGVCGRIEAPEMELPPTERIMEAPYLTDNEIIWVRLILGKEDQGVLHLHVDAARDSAFTDKTRPKQSGSFDELQTLIEKYVGHKIFLIARARFHLSSDRLARNSVVPLLLGVEHEVGDKKARMSGVTLRLDESAVDKIIWERVNKPREGRDLRAMIYCESVSKVSDNYLVDSYYPIETVLKTFLTESGDERDS